MVSPRSQLRIGEGFFGGQVVNGDRINAVRSLAREGLGRTAIQSALRDRGTPLRGQSITEIVREFRQIGRNQPALNRIRDEFRPSTRTITQTHINLATEFRVSSRITLRNSETGETRSFFVRYGSNERQTIGEIEDQSIDIGNTAGDAYGFDEVENVELLGVEQKVL